MQSNLGLERSVKKKEKIKEIQVRYVASKEIITIPILHGIIKLQILSGSQPKFNGKKAWKKGERKNILGEKWNR